MNRLQKAFLGTVGALILLDVATTTAMSHYDSRTRQEMLSVVAQELRPHASRQEMDDFMRRHATVYSLDDKYNHEYVGLLPQTEFDKFFFDRKVQIALKVADDATFLNGEVRVFYTFL